MEFEQDLPKNKPSRIIVTILAASILASILGFVASFIFGRISFLDIFLTVLPGRNFNEPVNVLFLGIDSTEGVQRSDTIVLINLDPLKFEAKLIFIPRDSRVYIPGYGIDKVNHAYAYGGQDLIAKTVSMLARKPIDYYARISSDGLEKIVDKLGGVALDVEKRMYYVDHAGKLFVDLKPGFQSLSGRQAVGYIRFRHDALGDLSRISRQQKFMLAAAEKLNNEASLFRIPALIKILNSNVNTNLSFNQLLQLANIGKHAYENKSIIMISLPGNTQMINGVSYLVLDESKVSEVFRSF